MAVCFPAREAKDSVYTSSQDHFCIFYMLSTFVPFYFLKMYNVCVFVCATYFFNLKNAFSLHFLQIL